MNRLPYSLVIATCDRADELAGTLESVALQTRRPESTVVVDTSRDPRTREVVRSFESRLPLRYERGEEPSAAIQRNQGARGVTTPLIAFMDDDIRLAPDAAELICSVFDSDSAEQIGGVAARIDGLAHPVPHGPLRWYYRLQAGYRHETYGGRLFGPAINCLPSYTEGDGVLIAADWLNSTCVFYRAALFFRELFPVFHGYSFMEDVHLSARVGRTHKLYFHANARCEHHDAPGAWKRDRRNLARMRVRNQRTVARDVMKLSGPVFELKLLLHRLFASVSIARRRDPGWIEEMIGTWT